MKLLIGGKSRNIYMRKDGSAYYKSGGEKVDASYMFKKNGDFKKQYSKSVEETLTKVKESHHIKNNKKFYGGAAIQFDFQPIKVTFTGKNDNEKKKELMKIVHIAYNVMLEQLHTQEKPISKYSMKQIRSRLMDWVNNATLGAKNNNVNNLPQLPNKYADVPIAVLNALNELLDIIHNSTHVTIDSYYLLFSNSISNNFNESKDTTAEQRNRNTPTKLVDSVIEVADTIRKRIASEVAPAQAQTNGPVQTNDDAGENWPVVVRQPAPIEDETAPSDDDAVENRLLLDVGPARQPRQPRQPRQILLKDRPDRQPRQHIDINAVD